MPEPYSEEVVLVRTDDGIDLEGLVIQPAARGSRLPILWIHTAAVSFSHQSYLQVGREIARRGCVVVSVNTRGHDLAAMLWTSHGMQAGGSAWERYEYAPHDVGAWVSLVSRLGGGQVVLAGHGTGAAKAVYYQARVRDPRVAGIVAASPSIARSIPLERLELARRMVAEGRGEALLPPVQGAPPWSLAAAQAVVSRETVAGRAFRSQDGDAWIRGVQCPLLAFYGTGEEDAVDHLETIRTHAGGPCETQLVQDADHWYSGRQREVSRQIVLWIRGLEPGIASSTVTAR